ncbi:uncharacterized protein V1516DRAFT_617914 [Lipomyces oligophaga]|uniref:uncharacterized protein n=1 Tax=Lipomyces oligophaga TaxID=45792 RepID=UPI0034CFAB60
MRKPTKISDPAASILYANTPADNPSSKEIAENLFFESLQKSKNLRTTSENSMSWIAQYPPQSPTPVKQEQSNKSSAELKTKRSKKSRVTEVPTIEVLNWTVLQRHDPRINKILLTSSHSVLYKFVSDTGAWEKLSCQGTLFVYSRRPRYDAFGAIVEDEDVALAILNRHSIKNFFIRLEDVSDVERIDEFIMLRSPPGMVDKWEISYEDATVPPQPDVWGIWIYEESDRPRVESLCRQFVPEDTTQVTATNGSSIASGPSQSLVHDEDVLGKLFSTAINKFVEHRIE